MDAATPEDFEPPTLAPPPADAVDDRPHAKPRRRRRAPASEPDALASEPAAAAKEENWGFEDESEGFAEWKLGLVLVLALMAGFGVVAWKKFDAIKELAAAKVEKITGSVDEADPTPAPPAPATLPPPEQPAPDAFVVSHEPPLVDELPSAEPGGFAHKTPEPAMPLADGQVEEAAWTSPDAFAESGQPQDAGYDPFVAAPPAAESEPPADWSDPGPAEMPTIDFAPVEVVDLADEPTADPFAVVEAPATAVAAESFPLDSDPADPFTERTLEEDDLTAVPQDPLPAEPLADPFAAAADAAADGLPTVATDPMNGGDVGDPFASSPEPIAAAADHSSDPFAGDGRSGNAPSMGVDPFAAELPPVDPGPAADPFASGLTTLDVPQSEPEPAATAPLPTPSLPTPAADDGLPRRVDIEADTRTHLVDRGETFWSISKAKYGTPRYFAALAEWNRAAVPNPNALGPGVRLELPPADVLEPMVPMARVEGPAEPSVRPVSEAARVDASHVVQSGETYWSIAKSHYGSVRYFAALAEWNRKRVGDPSKLRPGVTVELPAADRLDPLIASRAFPANVAEDGLPNADDGAAGYFETADGRPRYRVGPTDTLSGIAQATLGRASRWRQIYAMNRTTLASPDVLPRDAVLELPADAVRLAGRP